MQGEEICRQLKAAGMQSATAVIMLGDLSNPATKMRTEAAKAAFASPDCPEIEILEEQTATWQRNLASDLMTNWLSAGTQPDVVVANNDEMAIGAILAMKAVDVDMSKVIVAGIDATPDALAAMASGDMDVTVLQSAPGQGKAIVETMLKLVAGEDVPREVYVPYELVTPENYKDFQPKYERPCARPSGAAGRAGVRRSLSSRISVGSKSSPNCRSAQRLSRPFCAPSAVVRSRSRSPPRQLLCSGSEVVSVACRQGPAATGDA